MSVDLPTSIGASLSTVTGAIRKAAQATGASFDYLLATAKVESDLNPNLTMRSSSATGLFQMLEQTWFGLIKDAGNAVGLGRYASAISQTSSGRYVVNDPGMRQEILKLRKDPTANAVMAGVFTQQNASALSSRIGRKPTDGELYIAHFFGPAGAGKLINLAGRNPGTNAAAVFPNAARANRPIFYDKQGQPRSASGVYAELVRRYQVARGASASQFAAAIPPAPMAPVAQPVAAAQPASDPAGVTQVLAAASPAVPDGPVFHSLFRTAEWRGAVAPAVQDLWGAEAARARAGEAQTTLAPVATTAGAPGPLDLFQDIKPNIRGMFDGSA